jgi:hypothetical protein
MKKLILGTILAVLFALITFPILANSETVFTRDAIITGGGIITEGHGKDAPKITFGVNVFVKYFVNENGDPIDEIGEVSEDGQLLFAEPPIGNFHINFHNVGNDNLDKGKFTTTEITALRIAPASLPDTGVPYLFVNMAANGKFNGENGWAIVVRFSEFGAPGKAKKAIPDNASDAIRISVWNYNESDLTVYDTATEQVDFPWEQAHRTLLDGGNVTVYY